MTSDPGTQAETLSVSVATEAEGWAEVLPDPELHVARIVRTTLQTVCPDLSFASVSLLLADDAQVQVLNRTWRGKDQATNVLSFPATDARPGRTPEPEFLGVPLELGDVALAYETCEREARAQAKPITQHIDHLIVHGVLHLLGYDHMTEDEASIMEGLEVKILAGLGVPDPYMIAQEESPIDG
jgi:probable rRNA maturation factor